MGTDYNGRPGGWAVWKKFFCEFGAGGIGGALRVTFHPMAGTVPDSPGESTAKLPWDGIAELRDIPPARARVAYERADARLRWCGAWWAALLASFLVFAAALLLSIVGNRAFGRDGWFEWIKALIFGISGSLAVGLFFRITNRALRRFIRAELGTHCWQCDYDLCGTPDAIPPAIARCPECGRVIPRNVHRKTIVQGAAGGRGEEPEAG